MFRAIFEIHGKKLEELGVDRSAKGVAPQSDAAFKARASRWRTGVQADILD